MERVGQRVQVYWPDEADWFGGLVHAFDAGEGFFVVYDDGDERWEADAHLIRFESEEHDAQDDAGDDPEAGEAHGTRTGEGDDECGDGAGENVGDEDADGLAIRQALEPPESPTGYDDYEDADDVARQDAEAMPVPTSRDPSLEHYEADDDVDDPNDDSLPSNGDTNSEDEGDARDPTLIASGQAFRVHEVGGLSDMDDELEQSIAASDVPETCAIERPASALAASSARRLVPERGRLLGTILRASELPRVSGRVPAAFVKVSFAEAGDATGAASLMLRCKQALGSTPTAAPSEDPVWVEEEHEPGRSDSGEAPSSNTHFQLALTPPKLASVPLWDRVLGDLVLAVYSTEAGVQGVFLGQAVVALPDLLHELLSHAPATTRRLRLCARSGKPLPAITGSSGAPELVVSFVFVPAFPDEVKHRQSERARSAGSARSTRGLRDGAKKLDPKQLPPPKAGAKAWAKQPSAPSKSASSGINRRKFERQVAKENVALAKRLAWQDTRRAKLQADAKAQEKRRETPPQHGARKPGHKASSGINRAKFVQHVSLENRFLGKRLLAIGAKACKPAAPSQSPSLQLQLGFGREQDQALAADKRAQRRLELDERLKQAQATYARQHALVAEVTALQDDVARLKLRSGELTRACSRLDTLNRRDRHARDCLRATAAKETSAARALSTQPKAPATRKHGAEPSACSSGGGGDVLRQRECELLEEESARLEAEKQRQREQLAALEQERARLGDDARALEATLRSVLAQRAFSSAWRGSTTPAQARAAAERMTRRLRANDLSAEEEAQWALLQAHDELAQLQLALQVLEQRAAVSSAAAATRGPRTDQSSAAMAYLAGKVERATEKLQAQQAQTAGWRRECEALVAAGAYEQLRAQVQELQHLVFLCCSQGSRQRRAERGKDRTQRRLETDSARRVQAEQTEAELVLKKTETR